MHVYPGFCPDPLLKCVRINCLRSADGLADVKKIQLYDSYNVQAIKVREDLIKMVCGE
jgi:hypothetical protein